MNPSISLTIISIVFGSQVQAQTIVPDLSEASKFEVVNRNLSINKNGGAAQVHVTTSPNQGLAWIKNLDFSTGTIEFDVKGKDLLQQSFVGIAFHGANDSTFDAIYFRPFNFKSTDTLRSQHMVQYISQPQYDWKMLREKYPGKYEHPLTVVPDPNDWFHAKVVVGTERIEIFVNHDNKPSLTVKPLNHYTSGKIGLWVGNGSDGDFSKLTITK
jgi:hypothetical protein